jgi:dienelactone hydrolase
MTKTLALVAIALISTPATYARQAPAPPKVVVVTRGTLSLRALCWRPPGSGPFPAILFNHGSSGADDPISPDAAETLGPVFARHGYVFLFLFRQGIGLSTGQGTADGDQMARAFAAEGQEGRNHVQLQLLEGEELNEALAGMAWLRAHPDVDRSRIGVVGHSFGGSLSLLLAARDAGMRAVIVFGAAATSWEQSSALRARLLEAARHASAPIFFIHAANDYSTAPGQALAAEMQRLEKPHRLKIYPAVGHSPRDGHNLIYGSVTTWEADVFDFLDPLLKPRGE